MVVRCGKCRVELEIPGPGEFMCPSCGTRNVVRGQGGDPFGVPDLGGLSDGGGGGLGVPPPPPPPGEPPPGVSWIVCPACRWRFAVGEVAEVDCPTCSARLAVAEGAARLA